MRVLTSQPHIAGEPASCQEIQNWFSHLGFARLETRESVAWYRIRENLLVADAHEGNIVHSLNDILVPIDLNILQPSGRLREWALQAAH